MSNRIRALVGSSRAYASPARLARMLRRVGFQPNDASAAYLEFAGDEATAWDSGQSTVEGAATGASAGAVVGGVLGWLAGIGSLGVLGTDALIAIGPVLASGAGAGLVGAVGGLLGGLIGLRSRSRKGQSSWR